MKSKSLLASQRAKKAAKQAPINHNPPVEPIKPGCMCNCGQASSNPTALFIQGHDSKLKYKITRGLPTSQAAYDYARTKWGLIPLLPM